MPMSKITRAREDRFEKTQTRQLMKSIQGRKLLQGGVDKALIESVENVDTVEALAGAMPSKTESLSAPEASLAPAISSTPVVSLPPPENAHKPWKRGHEVLRIVKLGEPGRLALLASTYSAAESRSHLIKPREPEMSWQEVQAAVRQSPLPLKRKFDDDDNEEETPRPAKMSRFEERTALVHVHAPPADPYTTYHPTKARRKHALPTDDEEKLHRPKRQRCDVIPSINAHKPWKRAHEALRVMKLGEPRRLALLASAYTSAESRAQLTKPGEPEMSWEEVQAAVRESLSLWERKETPRPAKMSRFEERTALVHVYAPPTDPCTAYRPTKPRREYVLPTHDEEELHRPKKQRCDGKPSIFGPRRTSTGDEISPIIGPITRPRFDAVGYESPHQGPKVVDRSVPLNYPTPSVPKVEVESFMPPAQAVTSTISVPINNATPSVIKPEIESSMPPARTLTGTIFELMVYATQSVPKIQVERSPPPAEGITNSITPSSQPAQDIQISIPESPPAQRTNFSQGSNGEEEDLILFGKIWDNIRARAQKHLRKARGRARRSRDKRLVKKMEESRRLAKELGPIKHTGTRPPPSIKQDKNKEVHSPPEDTEDLTEPVVEKMLEIRKEVRRGAGFWAEEIEAVKAQREKMEKDKKGLIKMRERILKNTPQQESPLRKWES